MLCGPSGSGKSTVMKKLMAEFGEYFGFSVSHTTRQPRPGEEEGRDYHYVTREAMLQLVDQGQFIENAEFSGNMYGTSMTAVHDVLAKGKICILDIDVQVRSSFQYRGEVLIDLSLRIEKRFSYIIITDEFPVTTNCQ